MSLINKMLQDLEKRQSSDLPALPAAASVRTPSPRPGLRPAMLVLALLLLVAGAWALGQQMGGPQTPTTDKTLALAEPTPTRPAIPDNEIDETGNAAALQEAPETPAQVIPELLAEAEAEAAAESVRPPVAAAVTTIPRQPLGMKQETTTLPAATSESVVTRLSSSRQQSEPLLAVTPAAAHLPAAALPDTSPAASKSSTPTLAREQTVIAEGNQAIAQATVRPAAEEKEALMPASASQPMPGKQMLATQDAPASRSAPTLQTAGPAHDPVQAEISDRENGAFGIPADVRKQVSPATPKQRAEDAYRRATVLAQQGRANEAIASLEQALVQDGRHGAARQTLVGLLLEQQRQQEAVEVLEEGLALDRKQPGLAMLLARLQVERAALSAAIQTLEASLSAARKPDYHAFLAALYQRAGQHPQALESYRQALRQSPRNGLWWIGMAISLQASGQAEEARSAFLRAQDSGMLSPELEAFVRQRLGQLS